MKRKRKTYVVLVIWKFFFYMLVKLFYKVLSETVSQTWRSRALGGLFELRFKFNNEIFDFTIFFFLTRINILFSGLVYFIVIIGAYLSIIFCCLVGIDPLNFLNDWKTKVGWHIHIILDLILNKNYILASKLKM